MADIYLKCDHLVEGVHNSPEGRFPNKYDAATKTWKVGYCFDEGKNPNSLINDCWVEQVYSKNSKIKKCICILQNKTWDEDMLDTWKTLEMDQCVWANDRPEDVTPLSFRQKWQRYKRENPGN
jgi:hypothetical protein